MLDWEFYSQIISNIQGLDKSKLTQAVSESQNSKTEMDKSWQEEIITEIGKIHISQYYSDIKDTKEEKGRNCRPTSVMNIDTKKQILANWRWQHVNKKGRMCVGM